MATREINLISSLHRLSAEELQLKHKLTILVPLSVGLYCLILVAILVYSQILNQRASKIESQITSERERITSLSQNESLYAVLKQKAKVINEIETTRFPYEELYKFVKEFDLSYPINGYSFNELGEVSFTIKISDTVALDEFVNTIVVKGESKFKLIQITSINYISGGSYELVVSMLAS